MKFYPYKKGAGAGKVLAIQKCVCVEGVGHKKFWGSKNTVA